MKISIRQVGNWVLTSTLLLFLVGCGHSVTTDSETSQPAGNKMNLVEASMNFDSANVRPFLERLKPLIESGFSDREILQVHGMMESLKVGEQKELVFPITYGGSQSALRFRILMDDVNSPDVFFFADPRLAKQINQEMEKFTDELGI